MAHVPQDLCSMLPKDKERVLGCAGSSRAVVPCTVRLTIPRTSSCVRYEKTYGNIAKDTSIIFQSLNNGDAGEGNVRRKPENG